MVRKLSNITPKQFRKFLLKVGCIKSHTSGGHEVWEKKGLCRPIIVQTHVNPLIGKDVRSNLKTLQITKLEFFRILED